MAENDYSIPKILRVFVYLLKFQSDPPYILRHAISRSSHLTSPKNNRTGPVTRPQLTWEAFDFPLLVSSQF